LCDSVRETNFHEEGLILQALSAKKECHYLSYPYEIRDLLLRVKWLQTGFGLMTGFIEYLQNVTTNNYDSLTELHTPKITVATTHINSSQSLLAVAW
jgi:hypothetical protein